MPPARQPCHIHHSNAAHMADVNKSLLMEQPLNSDAGPESYMAIVSRAVTLPAGAVFCEQVADSSQARSPQCRPQSLPGPRHLQVRNTWNKKRERDNAGCCCRWSRLQA